MTVLRELERGVLTVPLPEAGLEAGDVGTVVHVYADGKDYEMEFVALDGHTRAVATIEATQVRGVNPWLEFAEMFKDDPYFDEWQEAIAENRRKADRE